MYTKKNKWREVWYSKWIYKPDLCWTETQCHWRGVGAAVGMTVGRGLYTRLLINICMHL